MTAKAVYDDISNSVLEVVADAGISAGVRTLLLGGDFGDRFLDSLKYYGATNFIEPIGSSLAGDIINSPLTGDVQGSLSASLLHAVVGAAGGYVTNGLKGLAGGALGAFASEFILGGDVSDASFNANISQIIGGLASLAVGDASMAGADTAYNSYVYNTPAHAVAGAGYCAINGPICVAAAAAAVSAIGVFLSNLFGRNGVQDDPQIWQAKPPDNAWDANGPKAPGYPGGVDGYTDPKGGPTWVPNPNGRGYGWQDAGGNVWVPTGQGGGAHGGPHWDVQRPGGGYINVRPPKAGNSK